MRKVINVLIVSLLCFSAVSAQERLPENWDAEKIRGTSHVPYPAASGSPYFNQKYTTGEVELTGGEKIGNLQLRYSSYRDELIYYNPVLKAHVIIDKISLKGFCLTDSQGVRSVFRQQYYDGFLSGSRFFQVLSDGDISLLAYRKVNLETCSPYMDEFQRLSNITYRETYSYYLYSREKGYSSVRMNKGSLLSKFSSDDQREAKRLLRKSGLRVNDESGFVTAWNILREKKLKVVF